MSPYRLFPANWTRRRVAWVVMAVGMVLIATTIVLAVLFSVARIDQVRTTQLDGTPNGKKLVRASERIISCTTPDGECTRENQRRTAELIAGLVQTNKQAAADAAACAAQPAVQSVQDTDARAVSILACMTRLQTSRGD